MTEPRRKTVVVGVDSTTESQLALRWAVDEARSRGLDLRVVRAYEAPTSPSLPMGLDAFAPGDSAGNARQELAAAVAYARDRLGAGHATGIRVAGRPAQMILDEAADAELVVVGSRHRTRTGMNLVGSVGTAVAAHAPCPVVVVRGPRWQNLPGRVVVGIDGSPVSDGALHFAFEEAARAESPLRVVHCWRPGAQAPPDPSNDDLVAAMREHHRAWMTETIAPYRDKFPEVKTTLLLPEGPPAVELVHLSRSSRLVVVGSRGRGGIKGLLMGSVSQSVLHHAYCSVAVIRNEAAH